MQCPLKFRYLVVDKMRQPPTEATIRGTVTHAVLEELFGLAPSNRKLEEALELVSPTATRLSEDPSWKVVFDGGYSKEQLQKDVLGLVEGYFAIERPEYIRPKTLESSYETVLSSSGIRLRGIIDRLDVSDAGELRVTDYKTGKTPSARYMDDALFQMRFYALILRDALKAPRRLQLLYLRGGDVLTYDPPKEDIDLFEKSLNELWSKLRDSLLSGNFLPRKSPLCPWCPFQDLCPLFGGTPPTPATEDLQRILGIQADVA